MKKTNSIKTLVQKNYERTLVYWRVTNRNKMFNVNGYWYDEQFFNQMFPKYEYVKYLEKGENPDKTHI